MPKISNFPDSLPTAAMWPSGNQWDESMWLRSKDWKKTTVLLLKKLKEKKKTLRCLGRKQPSCNPQCKSHPPRIAGKKHRKSQCSWRHGGNAINPGLPVSIFPVTQREKNKTNYLFKSLYLRFHHMKLSRSNVVYISTRQRIHPKDR